MDDKIVERCMAPSEYIAGAIDVLKSPAYEWPRRVYVLTWPVAVVLRALAFIPLICLWLVLGCGGFLLSKMIYIWRGEPSLWD